MCGFVGIIDNRNNQDYSSQIKSMLGDGRDLYGKNKLFNKERSQYQITISTIKSIRKLNISTLGEINGI